MAQDTRSVVAYIDWNITGIWLGAARLTLKPTP